MGPTTEIDSICTQGQDAFNLETDNNADVLPASGATIDYAHLGWDCAGNVKAISRGPTSVFAVMPGTTSMASSGNVPQDVLPYDALIQCWEYLYLASLPGLYETFHQRLNRYHYIVDGDDLQRLQRPGLSFDDTLLHCACLAAGAICSSDEHVRSAGAALTEHTSFALLFLCSTRPGVTLLQSLLVLTLTNTIQSNDYQARALNALAGEMARCLGLHVLSSASVIIDNGRRFGSETLCRLFWAHAYLDRVVAAMTGQLAGVQWRHVQTRGMDIESQDLPPAYFIAVCELWRTFDTIIDQIYTPAFDTLSADAKRDLHASCQAQLREVLANRVPRILIPSSPSYQDTAPEVLYFHIACHTAILLLDRPFLIDPAKGINPNALSSIKHSASAICKALQTIHKYLSWSDIPAALIFHIVRVCAVLLLLATSESTTS